MLRMLWPRRMAALLAGLPLTAFAFSFVPMTDADLRTDAAVIVSGQVVQVAETQLGGRTHTDFTLAVEEWFKGQSASHIVVRSLGAVQPSPGAMVVPGMPIYQPGQRGLWFLRPETPAVYRVVQFALGAFHEVQDTAGATYLVGAAEALASGLNKSSQTLRARDSFVQWLRLPSDSTPDYWRRAGPLNPIIARKFTLLQAGEREDLFFRWFRFDEGTAVDWYAHENGYTFSNGSAGGGGQSFIEALAVWSQAAGRVNYRYAGSTDATARLHEVDGQNTILWEDPFDEIAGRYDCRRGGALAVGTVTIAFGNQEFAGRRFMDIAESDVLTQDGAGCAFEGNGGRNGTEVFVHELGHTLGFGHSCGDEFSPVCRVGSLLDRSVMRSILHLDGDVDLLGDDDLVALTAVYPAFSASAPPREPSPLPLPSSNDDGGSGALGWLLALLLLAGPRQKRHILQRY